MYPFSVDRLVPGLATAVMHELSEMVVKHVPELKPDLPSFANCNFSIRADAYICIAIIQFKETGPFMGGEMPVEEFASLRVLIGSARGYHELVQNKSLTERFDWDRLLLATNVTDGAIDWHSVRDDLVSWLRCQPLLRALKINEKRVRLAIPEPPQYSLSAVREAMWVLECDQTCIQATAFNLAGYGTITNEHVVSRCTNLKAFRADDVASSHDVRILKRDAALDLAIIDVDGGSRNPALELAQNELNQMDHVAVCGFPNYRRGDSGVLAPGIVVGTRMKSGVQRLLTNAGIIAGMSGGPAIGRDNRVVGICVTGPRFMQDVRETEDQSIIPVRALDLLE